jgi:Tol biopolymer transport system component
LTDTGAWPLQWAADEESIYYRAWEGGGRRDVYLISRHGSGKRRALSFPADFIRVSPDEKWVAIVAGGVPRRRPWPEYSFWTTKLDRSTGVVRNQAARHAILPNVGDLDWSPDSRWLVFALGRRIAVVRANGRGMKTLIEESVGDRLLIQPNWSPNGQAIVFVKRPIAVGWLPRDRPEVWIMGKDGSEPRRIGYGVFPHWTSESTLPLWKTDLAY